jgi:hypothetical protein
MVIRGRDGLSAYRFPEQPKQQEEQEHTHNEEDGLVSIGRNEKHRRIILRLKCRPPKFFQK